jgi:amino-acid N-acetyltransferase
MKIRNAKTSDAEAIHSLINYYAELDRMLFCSVADVYERLQIFKVAEDGGRVVGCCALQVIWSDLAEIKSLAVDQDCAGRGAGRGLVEAGIADARGLGVKKVFTLTLEAGFFEKIGFVRVDKDSLPMKVWSDCARCSKQDHCDEIAMVCEVTA